MRAAAFHPFPTCSLWLLLAALGLGGAEGVGWAAAPYRLALRGSWQLTNEAKIESVALAYPYAYVAAGSQGLVILDIRKPSAPKVVSQTPTAIPPQLAFPWNNNVLLSAADFSSEILDVSNPAFPTMVSLGGGLGTARGVQPVGNSLYAACGRVGFVICNFVWGTLVEVGRQPLDLGDVGVALNLRVRDGLAYVACGAAGFRVVSTPNPSWPTLVAGVRPEGFVQDLDLKDNVMLLACRQAGVQLWYYDGFDPRGPGWIGEYKVTDVPGATAESICVQGNLAFVAYSGAGVRVLDVSNLQYPAAPPLVASTTATVGAVSWLTVLTNHVYVQEGNDRLMIYEYTSKLDQTIDFQVPASVDLEAGYLMLSAQASSGLPVRLSVASGPAVMAGNLLNLTGGGAVTVVAEQVGNTIYGPAEPVERTIRVRMPPLADLVDKWFEESYSYMPPEWRGPLEDPDADGASNAMEYFFGNDPTTSNVADGRLPLGSLPGDAGGWRLVVPLNPTLLPGTWWRLEWTSSLAKGSYAPVPAAWLTVGATEAVLMVPRTVGRCFVRLVLTE